MTDNLNWQPPTGEPQPPGPAPQTVPEKPKMGKGKKILIGSIAGLFAIGLIGSMGDDPAMTPSAAPAVTSSTTSSPAPTAAVPSTSLKTMEPTDYPTATPEAVEAAPAAPAAPALTSGQENAIETAQQYLDYSAFSRKGLIKQLVYEKYSKADATFAVDYLKVDWNKQAALSAEQYLEYSAFSKAGLIDQLEYEGFTPAQARYGANAAL